MVLPLPYRQPWTVYHAAGVDRNLLFNRHWNWFYQLLDGDAALALFATEFGANNGREARQIYDLCFSKSGVKKIGFFTLLASCGQTVSTHPDFQAMAAENPNDPLVGFLALHSNRAYARLQRTWGLHGGGAIGPKDSFLHQLSAFHDLYLRWQNNDLANGVRRAEELRALDFVKQNRSVLGWSLLTVLQDRSNSERLYRDIAETYKLFDDGSAFGYAAQYEHARSLYQGDRALEAADHFTRLYQKTLEAGVLPPLDGTFRAALQADQKTDRWTALMRQAADKLKADKRRTALIALAWQCYQLGDTPLAENLVADALRDPKDDSERLQVTLVAIEFLTGTGQYEKADSLLTPLLADARFNSRAMLWRLGADQRRPARTPAGRGTR